MLGWISREGRVDSTTDAERTLYGTRTSAMRQRLAQFAPHARLNQVNRSNVGNVGNVSKALKRLTRLAPTRSLIEVFETNEGEEPMDAVVRRFWSRTRTTTKPNAHAADAARAAGFARGERVTDPSNEVERALGGVVVDLAQWTRGR